MSILLDAVSRSKQQDEVFDPIAAPRPLYRHEKKRGVPKALLLPAALSIAVAAAWGVNSWLSAPSSLAAAINPNAIESHAAASANVSSNVSSSTGAASVSTVAAAGGSASNSQVQAQAAHSGELADGVRLAGKAALPTAVTSLEPAPVMATVAADLSFDSAEETPEAQAARMQALMAASVSEEQQAYNEVMAANITEEQQQVFNEVMAVEESRPLRTLTPTAPQSRVPEPSAGLDALQAEVDKAAADVGLHRREPKPVESREKSAAPLSGDALVKAFEDALKEVEFDNATKREVSPEPLATIPKTSDFPRYGDLPAALQLQVPEFNIVAHVYSNDPSQRWLNVDGAELQEGDSIKGKLKVVEIRPRDVLLAIDGTTFKVPSI
ncbi:general secretion pathway protein GspB [Shewanella sp. JM162201]|uniref:General secretion pathway protein GspB n=1 Tax=Shewanella jiangmenensis TaxID=2837387 RepID=A0ABS5V3R7_9GAMM|nr:general secretion pathway protein GspB [Shewanella jiangmenensis]MBT1444461.1 general secretion pathway protein GspB [Shewanella jiangmenensis]